MGTAGRYSDRFFEPGDKDVPAAGSSRADVIGIGKPDDPHPSRSRRWTRVAVGVAAVGVVAAILAQQGDSTPVPPEDDPSAQVVGAGGEAGTGSGTNVASRAGVTTVPLTATSAEGVLWKSRGYSYVVQLWNSASTPLAIVDVSATASGTEILWNDPVAVPSRGAARLKVDFLLVNCAAAGAPAPDQLRLQLRAPGSTELVVAEVAVEAAAHTVNESPAPRCPGGTGTGGYG
jgi:hypothetical protein